MRPLGAVAAGTRSDDAVQGGRQLSRFGEAVGAGVLAEDVAAVHGDVEDAAPAADDPQLTDHVLVGVEHLPGRAHGAVGIVSSHAVGDADAVLHRRSP